MKEAIEIRRAEKLKAHPDERDLGFGKVFTDHMFLMDYTAERGWHSPRVVPYGSLSLDPAAAVFHYGQAMFEGLKAFRSRLGKVRLFRAERHCRRIGEGAPRLCMPAVDSAAMLEGLTELVRLDKDWVPKAPGTALYIRPAMIATEPFLGVRASSRYTFFIILSPVGSYYAEGMNPVKIWVEDHFVRAAHGGLGAVKTGANYAASLLAAAEAKKKGYSQVLWLDAIEHRFFEEVGTMNLFVRIGDEVVTPPLEGSILDGVTRDTVLTLLRAWGVKVNERRLSIDEVADAHRRGSLKEVFGSGTAAVISPVGELNHQGQPMVVSGGKIGELSQRLYQTISAIQYGDAPDPYGWIVEVG